MKERNWHLKKKSNPYYSILYMMVLGVYRLVFFLLLGGRVRMLAEIPPAGPVLLMSNHIHALDPFSLALCSPKRQIHFLAKKELFQYKWLATILRELHAIPICRGQYDLPAVRKCMKLLQAGEVLGVFPEGTRGDGKQLQHLQSGAAILALRSNATVIPVFIHGKYRLFRGPHIFTGLPIIIDDLRAEDAGRDVAGEFMKRVQAALETLCTEVVR